MTRHQWVRSAHSDASVDDGVHALVGCTFAGVRNLVAERHDAAVLDVATAVRGGSQGACPLFVDVRRRINPNVPRVRKHAFLLPANSQHSVPDIIMIQPHDGFIFRRPDGSPVRQRRHWKPHLHPWEAYPGDRGACTLHLLELKYTFDLQVHETVSVAQLQHDGLVLALRQNGWGSVRLHPFIIGSCGMMRSENEHILITLGVKSLDVEALLKRLAIQSAERTHQILQVRRPFLNGSCRVRGGSRIHVQVPQPPELPQPPPPRDPVEAQQPPPPARRRRSPARESSGQTVRQTADGASCGTVDPPLYITRRGRTVRVTRRARLQDQHSDVCMPPSSDGDESHIHRQPGCRKRGAHCRIWT